MPLSWNVEDIDPDGTPSVKAIAAAINIETLKLPEGFTIDEVDIRDCLRPGILTGEVILTGDGPEQEVDRWTDMAGHEHVEKRPMRWGFRIRIDQVSED